MSAPQFPRRSLNEVVEQYVQTRIRAHSGVSMDRAILAIRTVLPHAAMDDQELSGLIAHRAAVHGCAVMPGRLS